MKYTVLEHQMEYVAHFIAIEPDPIKRTQMKTELNKTITQLKELVKE